MTMNGRKALPFNTFLHHSGSRRSSLYADSVPEFDRNMAFRDLLIFFDAKHVLHGTKARLTGCSHLRTSHRHDHIHRRFSNMERSTLLQVSGPYRRMRQMWTSQNYLPCPQPLELVTARNWTDRITRLR